MSAATRLLSKLGSVKKTKSGWSARCPAHADRQASLSIGEGSDGRVLLNCHAGCDYKKILAALKLEERDLFDANATAAATTKKKSTSSKPTSKAYATADEAEKVYERTFGRPSHWIYRYFDAKGDELGQVLRWDRPDGKKEIRPISRHVDGWRREHMAEPRPLYSLPDLAKRPRDRVYVVEGEKCVEALSNGLNLLATTSSAGSNAASKSDWSPLAGREVVILPDNDDAGRKYADDVAAILHELDPPATVRVVELDGLEAGGDVADLWEGCFGHGDAMLDDAELKALRDKIDRLAAETEPLKPKVATASTSPATPSTASTRSPIEAWRPFPTATLPKVAASLVAEAARAIGCDEAFVALPLLAVLGSAIGTTRRVELKPGWSALPIVWPVTVAESGSQKSPGADVSLDPVREIEDRLVEEFATAEADHEAAAEEYEKARAAWRSSRAAGGTAPQKPRPPVQRRVLLDDLTIESLVAALADNPRGVLVAHDELSAWFGGMGRYNGAPSADEAFWLKAFSGRSHNVSRRTSRSLHVRSAAVWLTGSIQPGVLARALGVERRESGLLARLLLAAPPRRPKRWTTATIDWMTRENFVRVLARLHGLEHELVDGRPESRIVRLSGDAETLFVGFADPHNEETIQHSGDLAAAWSKLEEAVARIALVFHQTRHAAEEKVGADEIDDVSMAAAIELVEWFKHETRRVYAILAETDLDRIARQADDRLAAFVDGRGGRVATRDVVAGVRSIGTADEAEEALQRLVDAGRGRWIDKPTTERGGRPTRFFELAEPVKEPIRLPSSAQPAQEAAKPGCACADVPQTAQPEAVAEEEALWI